MEAVRTVFVELRGRAPVGDELYEAETKLSGTVLLDDWHETWKDRVEQMTKPLELGGLELASFRGRRLYFLTLDEQSKNLSVFRGKGCKIETVRAVPFLDAPPAAFAALRLLRRLTGKPATPDAIWVYRITVP